MTYRLSKLSIACVSAFLIAPSYAVPICSFNNGGYPPLFSLPVDKLVENKDAYDTLDIKRYPSALNQPYGTFIQGFLGKVHQDNTENEMGYKGDGQGMLIGFDRQWYPYLRGGFAYAFSQAKSNMNTLLPQGLGNSLHINSQQGMVFIRYEACDLYYSSIVSMALNTYSQDRSIVLANESEFTGWQFNGKVELGYEFTKQKGAFNYYIIPHVRVDYRHLSTRAHQDSDNVSFDTQPLDYANLGLGVLLSMKGAQFNTWQYKPYMRLILTQAILNEPQETFVHLNGEEDGCVLTGIESSQYGRMVGLGILVNFNPNNSLSLEYDYESKSHYHMSAGFIKYRFEWC